MNFDYFCNNSNTRQMLFTWFVQLQRDVPICLNRKSPFAVFVETLILSNISVRISHTFQKNNADFPSMIPEHLQIWSDFGLGRGAKCPRISDLTDFRGRSGPGRAQQKALQSPYSCDLPRKKAVHTAHHFWRPADFGFVRQKRLVRRCALYLPKGN